MSSNSSLLDNTILYNLARNLANANYSNTTDPLGVPRVQQAVIAAALQGQFAVNFEYPKTVSQAMVLQEQGNVPDFDPTVLAYYRSATQAVFQAFTGSQFSVGGLPNATGFKVSWSQAQATEAPATSSNGSAQ